MSTSCSDQRYALLECLADSPCIAMGKSVKECMDLSQQDTGCKEFRQALFLCKRGQVCLSLCCVRVHLVRLYCHSVPRCSSICENVSREIYLNLTSRWQKNQMNHLHNDACSIGVGHRRTSCLSVEHHLSRTPTTIDTHTTAPVVQLQYFAVSGKHGGWSWFRSCSCNVTGLESPYVCVCITRLNAPSDSVYYDRSGLPRTRVHQPQQGGVGSCIPSCGPAHRVRRLVVSVYGTFT